MANATKKFNFTKDAILDRPLPPSGKVWWRDAGKKGLALEVTSKGNRTFWFLKTFMGKRLDRSLGRFPDLKVREARLQVDVYLGELAKDASIITQAPTIRGSKTLDDFFEDWIEDYAKAHRPGTWEHDQCLYKNHIQTDLGHMKVPTIRTEHIKALHKKIGRKTSKHTGKPMHRRANAMLQLISTMFNYAKKWKLYTGPNPAVGIEKYKENSIIRYLSKAEYSRLEGALLHEKTPAHIRQIAFMALFTGQRAAPVLGMKWRDIDLAAKRWTVTAADSKNDDPISVPLADEAVGVLKELMQGRRPGAKWVFPATRGDGHRTLQHKAWTPVLKRANITEFRFHDLRHNYASWLAITGASLNTIKDSCGHRSIQTTIRYAHLDNDSVRKATGAAINAMTGGKKTKRTKPPKKGGK